MKKKLKYIFIMISILGMIYAKNIIDANNKARIQMLDNLDDGTTKVK